jgi:recombination protein RecT
MTAVATTTPEPGTAVITRKGGSMSLAELMDTASDKLAPLLFPGTDMERVKSELFFAARKDPKIAQCTPESIVRAVATCIRRDLVIGEGIHLVPMNESYKENGEWQKRLVLNAWNDWKGDIELVLRSGAAQSVKVMPVFENEKFDYVEGLEPTIYHEPSRFADKRGAYIGSYMIARLRQGHYQVTWVPLGDIEEIRAKSKSLGPKDHPVCPPWYGNKTAVHAGCKKLPKNPKLRALLQDQEIELGIGDATLDGQPVPTKALPPIKAGTPSHPTPLAGDGSYDPTTGEDLGA